MGLYTLAGGGVGDSILIGGHSDDQRGAAVMLMGGVMDAKMSYVGYGAKSSVNQKYDVAFVEERGGADQRRAEGHATGSRQV